jgi:hypothetical protein
MTRVKQDIWECSKTNLAFLLNNIYLKLGLLQKINSNIMAFWNVTQCSLVDLFSYLFVICLTMFSVVYIIRTASYDACLLYKLEMMLKEAIVTFEVLFRNLFRRSDKNDWKAGSESSVFWAKFGLVYTEWKAYNLYSLSHIARLIHWY